MALALGASLLALLTSAELGLSVASGGRASGLGYTIWYTARPRLDATRAAMVQLAVPPCERAGKRAILPAVNWDDLRFLVAVAREKTVAAASHRLGVDQTTVARRLRALEESLGAVLFERSDGRWRLTAFGRRAVDRAGHIEEDVAGILRFAESESQLVSGVVRLTSPPTTHSEYLVHRLPELFARHPDLVIDLVDSDANLDITRHEVDVAIRAARPESGDFIMRKLAVIGYAVYESARPGVVTRQDEWVAYGEDLAHVTEMRWLEAHIGAGRIRLRDSGLRTLCGAIAGGIGRGLLPCMVGDPHPELRRSTPGDRVVSRDLWLLVHPESRESARVAVVTDWLVERFTADARLFDGSESGAR